MNWIKCKDRQPEKAGMYLVHGPTRGNVVIEVFTPGATWISEILVRGEVTHWMEVPEPPDYFKHLKG